MLHQLLGYPIGYIGLLLEAILPVYIVWKRLLKGLEGVAAYLLVLAIADGLRAGVVHAFGFSSPQYAYAYWLPDFGIEIAVFLVVSAFFRRAASGRPELLKQLRFLLGTVFVLVIGISSFVLFQNYDRLFTRFIIEFNQNLYFTCLVLTTLLYLMLVQIKSEDEQLVLFVSGLGISLAGPAASLALFHLTSGDGFARALVGLTIPMCNVIMLGIWFYAVGRAPRTVASGIPLARGSNDGKVVLEVSRA